MYTIHVGDIIGALELEEDHAMIVTSEDTYRAVTTLMDKYYCYDKSRVIFKKNNEYMFNYSDVEHKLCRRAGKDRLKEIYDLLENNYRVYIEVEVSPSQEDILSSLSRYIKACDDNEEKKELTVKLANLITCLNM